MVAAMTLLYKCQYEYDSYQRGRKLGVLTDNIRDAKEPIALARLVHGIRNGQIMATGRAMSATSVRMLAIPT